MKRKIFLFVLEKSLCNNTKNDRKNPKKEQLSQFFIGYLQ